MSAMQHLMLLPVLLPLVCAALLVLVNERRHRLKFAINLAGVLAVLACSLALLRAVDGDDWNGAGIYLAGNWSAPIGIVLVVDRLAALLLVVAATLALAALTFSAARWSRIGVHYHSLFQLLLMGLNGAFLTGDLFNLFVFFEVMLAASYGLLLHGYNGARLRAGMFYIVVNLLGSALFLIGIALIYGAAGTLNMADLAARIGTLDSFERGLLETGAAVLAVAFLTKSASWPLCFWLPISYAAASPPVAAMLVLVTKVGFYAVLRLWLLVFSGDAGASAHFGAPALLWIGLLTIAFGGVGMLANDDPRRLAGYSAILSSGTLLAALGFAQPSLVAAALFYLLSSTLALSAFMLLLELIDRVQTPAAAVLALTMEAFAMEDTAEETAGVVIPAALTFLGLAFIGCALVLAGLPPLSGFLAKFTLFHALLELTAVTGGWMPFAVMAALLAAGLATVIALMRYGVRSFWSVGAVSPPQLRLSEAGPIAALLLVGIAITVQAQPTMAFLDRTSADLFNPGALVERVFDESPRPGPSTRNNIP